MEDRVDVLLDSDLEDDVLQVARSLAESQGQSLGRVVSDLARRGYEFWSDDVSVVNHVSELPAFPPDPNRFPLFAQAVFAEVRLQHGEMLYIPGRWWHWVTSFDRNLALSMWHAAEGHAGAPDTSGRREVDTITDASAFRPYFASKVPVVIRSEEVRGWAATTRWTDDYLKAASGERRHEVQISGDRHLQFTRGDHKARIELLTLGDFLARRQASSECHYLAQNDTIPRLLPHDWSIPPFWRECFEEDAFRAPLWYCFGGERGMTSPLHFDYYENLLAQITGSKTVLLFSPAQSPYLYRKEQQLLSPEKPKSLG